MFRIKICGVTSPLDARHAADSGADAIGLNFYPASSRFVDERRAAEIIAALPEHVQKIGVFVNMPVNEVGALADRLGLDAVQLHGDESPEAIAELLPRPVIKALRPLNWLEVERYVGACAAGSRPRMVLLDAALGGSFGGTGRQGDWGLASQYVRTAQAPPLVLAGGLNPRNVAEAIRTVRPAAVDVASGVEVEPGRKDPSRMQAFIAEARAAFASLLGHSGLP